MVTDKINDVVKHEVEVEGVEYIVTEQGSALYVLHLGALVLSSDDYEAYLASKDLRRLEVLFVKP